MGARVHSVKVHLSALRAKLDGRRIIDTVRSAGIVLAI